MPTDAIWCLTKFESWTMLNSFLFRNAPNASFIVLTTIIIITTTTIITILIVTPLTPPFCVFVVQVAMLRPRSVPRLLPTARPWVLVTRVSSGSWRSRSCAVSHPLKCRTSDKWVCLKIGYIPNYSHLIGIMISKTIGFRGTLFSDTPKCSKKSLEIVDGCFIDDLRG